MRESTLKDQAKAQAKATAPDRMARPGGQSGATITGTAATPPGGKPLGKFGR